MAQHGHTEIQPMICFLIILLSFVSTSWCLQSL